MDITRSQLEKIIKEEFEKEKHLYEMARILPRTAEVIASVIPFAKQMYNALRPDLTKLKKPRFSDETGEHDILLMLTQAKIESAAAKPKPKPFDVQAKLNDVYKEISDPEERSRIKFDPQMLKVAPSLVKQELEKMLAPHGGGEVVDNIFSELMVFLTSHNMIDTGAAAAFHRAEKTGIPGMAVSAATAGMDKFAEVQIRKSFRHKHGGKVGAAAGAAVGVLLGLPSVLGTAATGPWGAGIGAAAGKAGTKLYDKYLLSKTATESDLVQIGKLKKEESVEGEEPWDVNSWLDETIGILSPGQKKSIMYEEGELLEAGQEHGEPELASQIADYLAKEGMLDNEERPQLPAEEIPQIGVQDEMPGEEERMVAESFGRMNQLAGIIKG